MTKQSEFDPLATPDTGDYIDALEALGGGLYRNVKILKENLLVNSSDLTFKNGKGLFAGTTLNDLAYFGSRDVDGNVNVAHITAISANTPYALFGTTCFFTAGASLGALTGYLGGSVTPVGNVGVGSDDLISYTMVANQLNTNNRGVKYIGEGYTANNVNAKTIQASVGGTLVGSALTLSAVAADIWNAEISIVRTGTNTQLVTGFISKNGGTEAKIYNSVLNLTESGTIVIKMVAVGVANNDVVQGSSRIEHI